MALFPASVWGQRAGIRAVQVVSLVFFFIHAGIALANAGVSDPAIAAFNAASGLLFGASTLVGQRAHRDMDPIRARRDPTPARQSSWEPPRSVPCTIPITSHSSRPPTRASEPASSWPEAATTTTAGRCSPC